MKLRIMSDLHLEMSTLSIDGEEDEVLLLAGDTYLFKDAEFFREYLEMLGQEFKKVVFIAGNHEFYHYKYTKKFPLKLSENVCYLSDSVLQLEDTVFIGSTLWTDYGNNPNAMNKAHLFMNDCKCINYRGRLLTPQDCLRLHKKSKQFIIESLQKYSKDFKTVVMTHHAPSYNSIAKRYRVESPELNPAFYSDLEDLIKEYKPDLWVHGHVHNTFDYKVGETRVVCNPRGYVRPYRIVGENRIFDLNFTIDL